MAITELTTDLNIIAALDAEPNDSGASPLTPTELKAKFDEGPLAIQTYINDTLIPDIHADNIMMGVGSEQSIAAAISGVSLGTLPDLSITNAKMANSTLEIGKFNSNIFASQAQAEAGAASTVLMTPQRTAQAITKLTSLTSYNAKLTENITMYASPGSWYNGLSQSLPAGTYLILATATVGVVTPSSAGFVWLTLYDGTNVLAQDYINADQYGSLRYRTSTLQTIVTLATTTTISIRAKAQYEDAYMYANNPVIQGGNNATQLTAVKIA